MFAKRIDRLKPSLVREILAAAQAPGVISFAGGLPAAETLFQPELSELKLPASIWQYGASEGESVLRDLVAQRANRLGLACRPDQVLILNGSQQGIDLVAKLWVEETTKILCESPTYLAALQVFDLFGASFESSQADWLSPTDIEASQADFAYLIPTFQNPTGRCYSTEQRQLLAQAFDLRRMPVFEDDPYRDLAFDGPAPAPLVSHLQSVPWVYQGSFSKTLAPGLRLGYLIAHPDLIVPLTRLKQAADLHSNRLSQAIVTHVLANGTLDKHIADLLPIYREKRDLMHQVLTEQLAEKAYWHKPAGGLFFWLELKRDCDTHYLMQKALALGLAIMPGDPFYPAKPQQTCTLRLNFSHSSLELIEEGVNRLARLI
ncbi:PLP-dependent aminotransferase family protein [Chitinibacter fontanus]|uniref:Putative 8-amino-7-oxononanoate synthase n=1 Tax=Chitinibacter fontanus TaxID=1737446 RepID=A0A7D5Z7L6_9NEIS|nr:PLP-dependent aminotransferase family protein [Chitinibacter fontanus]QLI81762.1 PLP-dependent aminotransferase family protein [Chitinibacter fontanus]